MGSRGWGEPTRAEAASALRQVDGVYAAYTREDVLSGRLPDSRLGRAITAGASYLVIGRPIVAAEDPVAAAEAIAREMAEADAMTRVAFAPIRGEA